MMRASSFLVSAIAMSLLWGAVPPAFGQADSSAAKKTQDAGKAQTNKAAQKADATKPANAKKPKAGRFASEAEARAKCPGTVVWVDQHNFNHYEGSREWGVKPGAFGCEH